MIAEFHFHYKEIEERIPEATGSAMVQQLSSAATTGWDDPTEVSWGEDDEEEKDDIVVSEPKEAIFKCTALYSYSVSTYNYIRPPSSLL